MRPTPARGLLAAVTRADRGEAVMPFASSAAGTANAGKVRAPETAIAVVRIRMCSRSAATPGEAEFVDSPSTGPGPGPAGTFTLERLTLLPGRPPQPQPLPSANLAKGRGQNDRHGYDENHASITSPRSQQGTENRT